MSITDDMKQLLQHANNERNHFVMIGGATKFRNEQYYHAAWELVRAGYLKFHTETHRPVFKNNRRYMESHDVFKLTNNGQKYLRQDASE
jgi:hypothetical protein